ncbi:MAG: lysophospholipid acyltransferase family protein [Candidatus Binatia bacterium]
MKRVIDWLFTVPFLAVFGLTLAIFDPLQRIARLFGPRTHELVVGALQTALILAFRLCGTSLQVEQSPEIAPWTPYLIVANHQSMFDVPIFGALLFTNFPKYVAKRSLARWIPSISYNLRRGGNAIIDRGASDQALAAIRELGARVEERHVSAVIFPEGTRARGGDLAAFRPRGTLELFRSAPGTAVVPVAIDGSWKLLRHNMLPVPFGTRVRVYVGAPIPRTPGEDLEALLQRVERKIQGALERWRSDPAPPSPPELN